MDVNTGGAVELLRKYRAGECTDQEKGLVETFYMNYEEGDLAELSEAQMIFLLQAQTFQFKKSDGYWSKIAVAASILLCLGVGFYFYKKQDLTGQSIAADKDIAPGGNKAFLILANGKRIALADLKNGQSLEQSGAMVTKSEGGVLAYHPTAQSALKNSEPSSDHYNTIEIPRGGSYQLHLPDGTKVWLNAATTLKYPVSFAAAKERRVLLSGGEAYFEVVKDSQHPFIVETSRQNLKVLGTSFNINNYPDENSVKTTVLEGRVGLNDQVILKPGQQGVNAAGDIQVKEVDVNTVVDWKSDDFVLDGESFQSTMRKIARWYDVQIVFDSAAPTDIELGGWVSRKGNISTILKRIEATGKVHFKIEGRRIIVIK